MKKYSELEKIIGYEFKDEALIEQALTHSSYANERKINKIDDYERLEYLGDAVLELTVSEFLFKNEAKYSEGKMTKMRASLVCEVTLSSIIRANGIQKYVLLGKGEEGTGGRNRDSILCDVFEAIAGAIYLDGGIKPAVDYINTFLLTDWQNKMMLNDSKTILQEKVQEEGKTLTYNVVKEEGPPHNRTFYVQAIVGGIPVSDGVGTSKKAAEQMAAYNYLKERA